MENELIAEEQVHKKGRHRKKHLYNSIMQQMEFYFSDSNLSKDKFLLPMITNDPYVEVATFMTFNKIRKLTTNIDDLVKAINNSQLLELSNDKTKVKRIAQFNMKQNVDNCTIYVERIKVDATHEWLSSVFSEFGNVTYVSIPKYKHNKVNRGFAFIEFEKEKEAIEALNYFESIGCKMSSLIPAENLCSIATYESSTIQEQNENQIRNEDCNENITKKRKHSTEDIENKKKIKVDITVINNTDNNEEHQQNDEFDEKRKKKHKKAKKKIFKELGLQVLSKTEWKKIRNRYLDNQKKKMKQFKVFLHKKKYNHTEIKHKIDQQNKNTELQSKDEQKIHVQNITFVPGVIVKIQLLKPSQELKNIKDELQQYSTEIKYVDVPSSVGNEAYLRFSDSESAKKFCLSNYKGQCLTLQGEEEEKYWNRINDSRSLKIKKNQKRLRGREKLLKKAEKELSKHIKFDDTD